MERGKWLHPTWMGWNPKSETCNINIACMILMLVYQMGSIVVQNSSERGLVTRKLARTYPGLTMCSLNMNNIFTSWYCPECHGFFYSKYILCCNDLLHETWYHKTWSTLVQSLCSISGKMSYRQVSWSLKAARLNIIIIVLWNLTGISAAMLPRCL